MHSLQVFGLVIMVVGGLLTVVGGLDQGDRVSSLDAQNERKSGTIYSLTNDRDNWRHRAITAENPPIISVPVNHVFVAEEKAVPSTEDMLRNMQKREAAMREETNKAIKALQAVVK